MSTGSLPPPRAGSAASGPSTPPLSTNPTAGSAETTRIDALVADVIELLDDVGRDDLATKLRAARVRMARPAAVVCVVGEFKQGKSSLVNAYVERAICPVDDDIATSALTLVRHGDEAGAVARITVDGAHTVREIPLEDVRRYVTEIGGNGPNVDEIAGASGASTIVERVDVRVPSEALADGLVLVDTPGAGGMAAGHAATTLGFLPFADGLLFVTDLTSELTAPEIEFLRSAHERCPHVMVVETKSDLFPSWRQVHDLNVGHLARLGLSVPVLPVSCVLAEVATQRQDDSMFRRSGLPALRDALRDRVVAPSKLGAAGRAASEASVAVDLVGSSIAAELEALDDPGALDALAARAGEAIAKLEQLRGPGARWNIVLGDRLGDLSNDVHHSLRSAMRELSRELDEAIETLRTAEEWDALSTRLQAGVSDAVGRAFVQVESTRLQVREELAALIAHDDLVALPSSSNGVPVDVAAFWRGKELDPRGGAGKSIRSGLNSLRGAQGGVMMLGISGHFLPQAAAVFMLSNPVMLAAGALFGGLQVFDERKRRVQARRQAARSQTRMFIDDVQFAVGNELSALIRTAQRGLRDEFTELIGQLQRTWADTAKRSEDARTSNAEEIEQRRRAAMKVQQRVEALRQSIGGSS
jgi:hypothetical protein